MMSRIVRADFSDFVRFLEGFSFQDVLTDLDYQSALKGAHGQFLSLLSLSSELRNAEGAVGKAFLKEFCEVGDSYLGEVVSDASESIMCLAVGALRSSAAALRSSIESFSKTFSAAAKPDVLTRTSVPEVFALAAKAPFFCAPVSSQAFLDLKSAYGELNQFVHTVAPVNMFSVPAVGHYPKFSDSSKDMSRMMVRVNRLMILSFLGARPMMFAGMDYRNRDVIVAALTKPQRRVALGVDG